jgi:spermidine/putrescine transport system substrate-binding protein
VARSPLVFPPASLNSLVHHSYPVFKNYGEFNQWNGIFNPIIQA